MKTFLRKTGWFALIGVIPFFAIVGIYIIVDPFKVIKTYDPIYLGNVEGEVITSRDYVGTVTLLNNYQKVSYDSFVFGNSCSFIYGVEDWKKHLPVSSNCYHYNAPLEALYAIVKKVEFIDRKGMPLKNVLLVLDHETLIRDTPNSGHLFMMSPQLVNYENIVDFHLAFFKAFVTPDFLKAYIDFNITGQIKPYMVESHLLNSARRNYNGITNELRMDYFESLIENGEYFTPDRLSVFYERETKPDCYPKAIMDSQKALLQHMLDIFEKQSTDYKIIISPLYDQRKLHSEDLAYLRKAFGEDRVFDFSGKNAYTEDPYNYYENVHYRAHVAREIMDKIYEGEP